MDTRCADLYRKGADGMWVLHPFEAGQIPPALQRGYLRGELARIAPTM